MIQVRFEEAESRTLSETGPKGCVVFCWEGDGGLSTDQEDAEMRYVGMWVWALVPSTSEFILCS